MHKLHDAQLPNDTLYLAAVRANFGFPALLVDLLDDLGAFQVVDARAPELLKELASCGLFQEHSRAVLTDILEGCLDILEVPDVEDGER